jgi:D-alanyl-D-alanine carboxypeptidase/D-alanyl-D-alanine-endopeptidase (penicillin-binding protein 4)
VQQPLPAESVRVARRRHPAFVAGLALAVLAGTACGGRRAAGTVPDTPDPNPAAPHENGARPSIPAAAAAVSASSKPATPPPIETPGGGSVAALRATIDGLLARPHLARSSWAIDIRSLDQNDTLYALRARSLMMPASNMKVLTVAAAAERLGWDYRFETTLFASGPVVNGTLQGDLVVRGTGDPTIGERLDRAGGTFDAWAELLASYGLRAIEGRIIGDDNALDDEGIGAGWAWDYLADGYAAPTGALVYNENVTTLVVRPGASAEDAVTAALESDAAGLTLMNAALTGLAGESDTLGVRRVPGSNVLRLTGRLPFGSGERRIAVSVDNPTEYFVRALKSTLVRGGIAVSGAALDMDSLAAPIEAGRLLPLAVHQSAPLADVATVVMKVSQNLYADTLFKTMGRAGGSGTAEAGRKAVAEVLSDWAIEPESYVMYDGSGLSRYNYVTAEVLVRVLRRMHADPRHAAPFIATLPVGAVDGSLARRFAGRPAERRVRAKTGSISNVRSLSGYVTTAGGETLAFAILANHFTAPQREIDDVTDAIVDALASFRRE